MRIHKVRLLFCSTMLVALAPTTVTAQSTPPTTLEQASQDPSVPVVAGDDDRSVAGEIIVTAQRRQERLIDVPLTVVALSAATLEQRGIVGTMDLPKLTPGLRIDHNGPYTQPAMRGISSTLTQAGNESPVAIYVDGLYQLSQTGLTFDLPDVKTIEVLKGPQGTLFGRNATGGAIQIFTLDPADHFSGRLFSSYGNYNDVRVDGFVTGPLAEGVSFSLSGSVHHNDGYLRDLVNGGRAGGLRSRLVRGKLRVEPTSNLTVLFTGFYTKWDSEYSDAQPLNSNSVARFQPGAIIPTRPWQFAGSKGISNTENYGGSLKIDLNTDAGTLSALTGYSRWDTVALADIDAIFLPNGLGANTIPYSKERVLSQELNFASRKFGRLSFVAGLFYYDAYGRADPQQNRISFPVVQAVDTYGYQPIKAAAAYGEATYEVTDRLTAIAGIRYSVEKRRLYGRNVAPGADPGSLPLLGRRKDSSFTPRASLKYKLTDETNAYFTYSRGFKSGAFNTVNLVPPILSVAPETVDAFELGSKTHTRAFSFNIAGFLYNNNNLQVSAGQLVNGIVTQTLQNAAAARIYGLDIDSQLNVTDSFKLSLGVALLHAKYTSYPSATINTPAPSGAGNIQRNINAEGNYLNRAPKVTVSLGAEYDTRFAGGELSFAPSLYYSSKYYFEAANRIAQPNYALLDARLSWRPDDTELTFAVYGRNLTNHAVINQVFPTAFSDRIGYQAPRTYGVSASYKF